ncbi:MAG: ferrochelatase [Caldilineaceae bacterium]|nr:ferrochelatase [Caldilineaceae bacterium]
MHYYSRPSYDPTAPSLTGVLLTNVGSPTAPTANAVRPYLRQFLGDPRIIELPRWLWWLILHGIILQTRPRRSARLYQRIWTTEGSPLLLNLEAQREALRQALFAATDKMIPVAIGMRYGKPTLQEALRQLDQAGVRRLLILPLYPQYSATTTGTSLDGVFAELQRWRWPPELRTVLHYPDHPAYIAALANRVTESWQQHGKAERLLLSFHGIPRSYAEKGDPYFHECQQTAHLLVERLGLAAEEYAVAFQSRFGPAEWLRPYTDELLTAWGQQGVRSVQVLAPGFSSDCLETLDELGNEGQETFLAAGGHTYSYIPALNARPDHIAALTSIMLQHLQGWESIGSATADTNFRAAQALATCQ